MINGEDWNKKDTLYYAVFYSDDGDLDVRDLFVVTNNFGKWLKQENKVRVDEGQEPFDAYDFELEDVEMAIYNRKGET